MNLILAAILGSLAIPAQTTGIIQTQTFQTSAGVVKITPIYHACAMIEGGRQNDLHRSRQAG